MATPSALLVWSFALLALVVGALFPIGLRHATRRLGLPADAVGRSTLLAAAGTAVWMAATFAAAASGRLAFGSFPPPLFGLFVLILIAAATLGFSRIGERLALGLPLSALVGSQAFRFPLELAMHRAYEEGVMPGQMSYSGLNFDIVTGITAIVVAALLWMNRMPRIGVWIWNTMGSLLVLNVVTIAWLSTPTPLRVFTNEPANVWITYPPFVWLPAVLVLAALVGHIVVFRRLFAESIGRVSTEITVERTRPKASTLSV